MAFRTADRVHETSTSTGTGNITLAGAVAGAINFASVTGMTIGDLVYYCIYSTTQFEVGLGTYSAANTLARTAGGVYAGSSGVGTLVSFSAGSKDVILTAPASRILQLTDNGDFDIPLPAALPAAPPAGNLTVFIKNLGGRLMLSQMGPSGLDTALQPHIGRNRTVRWQPIGNATTVPIVEGIAAPTALGTATARNVATTNIATRMKRLGYASAATAASFCGHFFVAGAQQYTIGDGTGLGGFSCTVRFNVSDPAAVSGARQFVGFRNVVTTPTNVEPNTVTNCFGLAQLSTDATQWYIVYGGSAAQTAIALGTGLGAPTDITTAWDLTLFAFPSLNNQVGYTVTNLATGVSVSGTLTGTAGTALPLSTAFLAPIAWRCNNATALACGLDVSSWYIETDQ